MRLSTLILRTFSILWLFTLLGGVAVYLSIEQNNRLVGEVQHGQEEITHITALLNSVLDLETGLRGYLLTGEADFLAPHAAARARLPGELAQLERQLMIDYADSNHAAEHLAVVRKVERQIEQWLDVAARPQLAAYQKDPALSVALVKTQKGKVVVDAIRRDLLGLSRHLTQEVKQKEALNQANLRRLQLFAPLGVLFALLVSIFFGIRLASGVALVFNRLRTSTQDLASGNLGTRAPLSDLYEPRLLAEDFNQMATALELAQHEIADRNIVLERRHREVSQLAELSDALQSCQDKEEGYRILGQALPLLFSGWSGSLLTLKPSRNLLETRAVWGAGVLDTVGTMHDPGSCLALRRGHTYEPSGLSPSCAHHGGHAGSYLCIPLLAQSEALGVLQLAGAPEDGPLPEHLRSFALTVAQQIALAIGNLGLRETLRQQSIRDPMTGLFNRRYLEETMERELHRATRDQQSVSVLAVDIDHFKKFNDTFGHEAGDAVLLAAAKTMQEYFRAEDIICRYGGEEFIIVLVNAPHEDILARANGFREKIAALTVKHNRQMLGQVTVSIGVATYAEHGTDVRVLINQADQALYLAKQEGRNRVESATALRPLR
ncbi:diguanylate cyclase [Deinococcus deserti]|uniref:Putative diguanylate-cyclase n=1 Tax=Deinococcus deserti (strain DSM 17065 / CIP 109153 / LMG 22923 / VCD115) TaxID=546414 RepID=C1CX77_DEIDV|nr:diguanylate cyclase [Deinococcus deserti]ACO46794.1 putative diguanylate-cyclase [Deinococcus deserti VCD115]